MCIQYSSRWWRSIFRRWIIRKHCDKQVRVRIHTGPALQVLIINPRPPHCALWIAGWQSTFATNFPWIELPFVAILVVIREINDNPINVSIEIYRWCIFPFFLHFVFSFGWFWLWCYCWLQKLETDLEKVQGRFQVWSAANEKRNYFVTTSLIGNQLWHIMYNIASMESRYRNNW